MNGIAEEARRADAFVLVSEEAYKTKYALRRMFAWQNQLLLEVLNSCPHLLEIGVGIGNFLVDAVNHCDQVHAVEVSSQSAKIALNRCPEVTSMLLAPAEKLPFRDNCFDAVVARGLLHHLENRAASIQEMHRVLRTGGYLVIFEGNPASRYRKLVLGLADWLGIQHEGTQYRHLWSEEITQLLSIFRQTRMRPVNGVFAPFAYVGLGNQLVWDGLSGVREIISRLLPNTFAWWLLWTAQK